LPLHFPEKAIHRAIMHRLLSLPPLQLHVRVVLTENNISVDRTWESQQQHPLKWALMLFLLLQRLTTLAKLGCRWPHLPALYNQLQQVDSTRM
jgi:hypothetical protein